MSFDAFVTAAVDSLTEQINSANAVADKVINADNTNKLIHEVRETSDDETIAKFREWFDLANAEILRREQEIDKYIVDQGLVTVETVDVDKETENYKALSQTIKAMQGALAAIPGGADAAKNLPDLKSLPGVRKSSSTGSSGGTGIKRPRLSAITADYGDGPVDIYETKKGENGQPDTNVANLTTLSKALAAKFKTKVEVKDLQTDLFKAAGTDDLSTLDGKPVTFTVSIPSEDGNSSHTVTVTATPTVK